MTKTVHLALFSYKEDPSLVATNNGGGVHCRGLITALNSYPEIAVDCFTRMEKPGVNHEKFRLQGGQQITRMGRATIFRVPYHTITGQDLDYHVRNLFEAMTFGYEAVRLAREAQNIPWDLIHTHYYTSGVAGQDFADQLGIGRRVHTTHLLQKAKEGAQGSPIDDFIVQYELGVLNRSLLITISDAEKAMLVTQYGIPESQIDVIPTGFDASFIQVVPKQLSVKNPILLSVGRVARQKGYDVSVEALRILRDEFGINAKLMIAGSTPRDGSAEMPYYQRLSDQIIAAGLVENVQFLGQLSHHQIIQVYEQADAIVHAARYESGLAQSLLEALVSGVPLVAAQYDGSAQYLNKDIAVCVQGENPRLLAGGIKRVLEDVAMRDRISKSAVDYTDRYRWDNLVKQVLDVYDKALSKSANIQGGCG